MKKAILLFCAVLLIGTSCEEKQDELGSLKAFAKAYGYVKYFHPSDEAANLDWNRFAAYGAQEMIECKTKEETIAKLNELFKPIAPSVIFTASPSDYDFSAITPEDTTNYRQVYWQHRGVSTGMENQNGPYRSSRVNAYATITPTSSFGNLMLVKDAAALRGKPIKYTGMAKLKKGSGGDGLFWVRVDKEDKKVGFFENMGDNPIKSNQWKKYEIVGKVDDLAVNISMGSILSGTGTMLVDDIHFYYQENNQWIEIPIKNNNFEFETIGKKSDDSDWLSKGQGYKFSLSKEDSPEGAQHLEITYETKTATSLNEPLFDTKPQFGELIQKEIGNGIFCQIPLSLYGTKEGTFPQSTSSAVLSDSLSNIKIDPTNLSLRLGNAINAYNVFQHFYPYFDQVNVNWEKEFDTILKRSFEDQTAEDHLISLLKFTAPLKDGHIWVSNGQNDRHVPAIRWEWIENQLVITKVTNDSLDIAVGDVVTKINNESAADYFEELESRISAGTKGWADHRLKRASIFGKEGSEITIEVNGKSHTLKRDKPFDYDEVDIPIQVNHYQFLDNNIVYLNLDKIEMDTIKNLMPQLQEARGIICDMRGYPNGNHELISHLLVENDTSKAWMRVANFIYPDQEKIVDYENYGWQMPAKEPYLGDKKVVFITDGSAISYAESYMGLIEGYNLATIVGQPTAGTNGNINPFRMLARYRISWTGMKVFKHDGSQHHAVGIQPDIFVNKTIKGLKEGRDEYLEEAIAVILKD